MAAYEKLRLVTRFEELKASDLVVIKKACTWCGMQHSGLLGQLWEGFVRRRGEVALWSVAWKFLPSIVHPKSVHPELEREAVITPRLVREGVVYVVETGADQEQYDKELRALEEKAAQRANASSRKEIAVQKQKEQKEPNKPTVGQMPHFEDVEVPDVKDTIKKAKQAQKEKEPEPTYESCRCW